MFLFLAPFFVSFEVLNMVFGYKQKEKEQLDVIIAQDIVHYRKEKGLKAREFKLSASQKQD